MRQLHMMCSTTLLFLNNTDSYTWPHKLTRLYIHSRANADILIVTAFSAIVTWVFASSLMYYAERHNPDPEIAKYYSSVPAAMWITLLNLTGESPLADYTVAGKIVTAICGIFAVGFFSIPIGACMLTLCAIICLSLIHI